MIGMGGRHCAGGIRGDILFSKGACTRPVAKLPVHCMGIEPAGVTENTIEGQRLIWEDELWIWLRHRARGDTGSSVVHGHENDGRPRKAVRISDGNGDRAGIVVTVGMVKRKGLISSQSEGLDPTPIAVIDGRDRGVRPISIGV